MKATDSRKVGTGYTRERFTAFGMTTYKFDLKKRRIAISLSEDNV